MFTISWQYLNGRAVATDPTNRQKAEWPPHPDRVFQALVAAWGETGQDTAQKSALDWLCTLPPPQLSVPEEVTACAVPKTYVPVNDKGDHPHKERYFPATFVGEAHCSLVWPDTDGSSYQVSLNELCQKVTYLGHSSSMVRMWINGLRDVPIVTYIPAKDNSRYRDFSLRVFNSGRLETLIKAYADGLEKWQRPPTANWQGYIKNKKPQKGEPTSVFDERLIVLRRVSGDRFGLESTLGLTEALRKIMIAAAEKTGSTIAKEILSGHQPNGEPSEKPHAAYLPLAFVGADHADGHLLGLAIALPRHLSREDEDACYQALAEALDSESNALHLTMGKMGVCDLVYEERDTELRPLALRPELWCQPSKTWATVTPITLDSYPKNDAETAKFMALSCQRIGLPAPCEIRIDKVSNQLGAPMSRYFPPIIRKRDKAKRWHIHAVITFAESVAGPIFLGAGRYRGYGVCKPVREQ